MFHHLTLIRVRDEASPRAAAQAVIAARGMAETIPSIVSMSAGFVESDGSDWDQAFEFAFENAEGFAAFVDHPVHEEFVARHVQPYADTVLSVDYDDVATEVLATPEKRRAS